MEMADRQTCLRTVQDKSQEEEPREGNLAKLMHAGKIAYQHDMSQVKQITLIAEVRYFARLQ